MIMKTTIFAGLSLLLSQNAHAEAQMPSPIHNAFLKVRQLAVTSNVRNLFMFNYSYYTGQFCKDQDCSAANIQKQIDAAKLKMGDDFEKYSLRQSSYERAISYLQQNLPKGDLLSLAGNRTAKQIRKSKTFVTCVDYAKAILAKAIEYGYPENDLKFYVLMNTDGYNKMCPGGPNGTEPVAPRPTVHTLIAYKDNGNWFTVNVEDPDAVPALIGPTLPTRLGKTYQFTFPALIAYQPLVFAGAFEPKYFTDGYNAGWLLGITAGGKLEADPTKIVCK